ncbi:arabinan endo-1,5-alpha-L-arabinosidase [Sphingomonas sp. MAHUQ-71]|uniref:Extracellular exo-alpha-(1->5)-L-arabinofuranosidase n=1 Tax=Sphingomonas oryzagri TaxID=3042314 RepID=A0ABT6N7A3_9SPHN|nr:arabinan endo-1,5-alpha-L-arabinosidase [Sphingomonas oryzagri]MDH7640980.1 arabinan endo-1,5-alpha-L-arabinosidase [Sphingomonas oryzagri]
MRLTGLALAAALIGAAAPAPVPPSPIPPSPINAAMTGDLSPVHDPVMIKQGDTFYVYGTGKDKGSGRFVTARASKDLIHWTLLGGLFDDVPAWGKEAVPGTKDFWAPDVHYFNGRYYLYYALSTFGSNRSAIGLATSPTLDPASPDYRWTDQGLVVMSTSKDDFNAIDPNHFIDAQGRHWLSLGSFWSGIKLFALNPKTGKLLAPDEKPISLARRLAPAGAAAPIEAPYLFSHGGWYYLLASYDYCCKGVNSTYYTVVGRSKDVRGPYLGEDGSRMLDGQGTVILKADLQEQQRFRGPGHSAYLSDGGTDYIVYHAYDKDHGGAPTLRISPIHWTADGWPRAAL